MIKKRWVLARPTLFFIRKNNLICVTDCNMPRVYGQAWNLSVGQDRDDYFHPQRKPVATCIFVAFGVFDGCNIITRIRVVASQADDTAPFCENFHTMLVGVSNNSILFVSKGCIGKLLSLHSLIFFKINKYQLFDGDFKLSHNNTTFKSFCLNFW